MPIDRHRCSAVPEHEGKLGGPAPPAAATRGMPPPVHRDLALGRLVGNAVPRDGPGKQLPAAVLVLVLEHLALERLVLEHPPWKLPGVRLPALERPVPEQQLVVPQQPVVAGMPTREMTTDADGSRVGSASNSLQRVPAANAAATRFFCSRTGIGISHPRRHCRGDGRFWSTRTENVHPDSGLKHLLRHNSCLAIKILGPFSLDLVGLHASSPFSDRSLH